MTSTLQQAVSNVQLNDYMTLATITAVAYDYVLTFPDEIKYIWNKRWTRISTIFVLARYFGLSSVIINALWGSTFVPGPTKMRNFQGNILFVLDTWCPWVFIVAADMAMILRVWALYGRSKIVLAIFLSLYGIEIVISLIFCIAASVENKSLSTTTQVLDFSFCVEQPGSSIWPMMIYSVQMVLGALMCLLVIYKFVDMSVRMYKATHRFRLNGYTNVLVREGMVYFLAVLTYALLNVLIYTGDVSAGSWLAILTGTINYIPAITLVPRFILNLRKMYARSEDDRSVSDIDTAFGIASAASRNNASSTLLFADVALNQRVQGEDIQMEMGGNGSVNV